MKKSTAVEWGEMPSVGRIKVKVAEKKVLNDRKFRVVGF